MSMASGVRFINITQHIFRILPYGIFSHMVNVGVSDRLGGVDD